MKQIIFIALLAFLSCTQPKKRVEARFWKIIDLNYYPIGFMVDTINQFSKVPGLNGLEINYDSLKTKLNARFNKDDTLYIGNQRFKVDASKKIIYNDKLEFVTRISGNKNSGYIVIYYSNSYGVICTISNRTAHLLDSIKVTSEVGKEITFNVTDLTNIILKDTMLTPPSPQFIPQ